MESHTSKRFREALEKLPISIQESAQTSFKLFQNDTRHKSMQFKKVHASKPIYSVRVSLEYRAVGSLEDDCIVWFWIGPHDEYEKLLARL